MSKQEELIEQKKREIQTKLQQKKKETDEALKKIQGTSSGSSKPKSTAQQHRNNKRLYWVNSSNDQRWKREKSHQEVSTVSASKHTMNIFSNDGSFLNQFKKISGGKETKVKKKEQKDPIPTVNSNDDNDIKSISDDKVPSPPVKSNKNNESDTDWGTWSESDEKIPEQSNNTVKANDEKEDKTSAKIEDRQNSSELGTTHWFHSEPSEEHQNSLSWPGSEPLESEIKSESELEPEPEPEPRPSSPYSPSRGSTPEATKENTKPTSTALPPSTMTSVQQFEPRSGIVPLLSITTQPHFIPYSAPPSMHHQPIPHPSSMGPHHRPPHPSSMGPQPFMHNSIPRHRLPPNSMVPHSFPPNPMGPHPMHPNSMAPQPTPSNSMRPHMMPPNSMRPHLMPPNSMGHPSMPPNTMGPHQMQPNSMGSHPLLPNSMGPHSMPPNSMGPHTMPPNSVGPRPMPPNSLDPHSMRPHSIAPNSINLHSMMPNSIGPLQMPPNSMGPRPMPPNSMGPRPMQSNSMGPRPLQPNSIGPHPMPPNSMGPRPMPPNSLGACPMPPNSMGPHSMPPNSIGPLPMPPNSMGPHPMPPNSMGPHPMPPNSMGPHPMQPNSMGPRQFSPNPMVPHSLPPRSMVHSSNSIPPRQIPPPSPMSSMGPQTLCSVMPPSLSIPPPAPMVPHNIPTPPPNLRQPPPLLMHQRSGPPPPESTSPQQQLGSGSSAPPLGNIGAVAGEVPVRPPPAPPQDESRKHLARTVAQCGDDIEDIIKLRNPDDPTIWFLHDKNSPAYREYRGLVEQFRQDISNYTPSTEITIKQEPPKDKDPEPKEEEGLKEPAVDQIKREAEEDDNSRQSEGKPSGEDSDEGTIRRRKKRRSRWAPEDTKVDVIAAGIGAPGIVTILPPGDVTLPVNESGIPLLSKVTRTDPALVQYAVKAFGTNMLSEEDWKKAEDHFKLTQDLNQGRRDGYDPF
uniref:SURP motif domain-containing protein n=1 Tax=Timema genevievae TaxID=629358 RepID=A0A7R9JY20_TIMGE|nr:unnamed protein product [Timema genevievae]